MSMKSLAKTVVLLGIVGLVVFSSISVGSAALGSVRSLVTDFTEVDAPETTCQPECTPCSVQDQPAEEAGMMKLVAYLWALELQMLDRLFVPGSGDFEWAKAPDGQWYLVKAQLPVMTTKGTDMMDSTMTMLHNFAVFLGQFSTLFPSKPLAQ
ncbi:MAG: hypothetical protein IBX68_11255 [Dehalococcoidia bacterium]|nr:hypothetical protein [Dehalococcoidia bacterium]